MNNYIIGVIADPEDIKRYSAVISHTDILEFRVDLFDSTLWTPERIGALSVQVKRKYKKKTLLTIRSFRESGMKAAKNRLTENKRLELFGKLMSCFDFADIELCSGKIINEVIRMARRKNKKLIISAHDFSGTPDYKELDTLLSRALRYRPDFVKIAAQACSDSDVIRLLAWTHNHRKKNLVTISMGEQGKASRFISGYFGSRALYFPISQKTTAPGQVGIKEFLKCRKAVSFPNSSIGNL